MKSLVKQMTRIMAHDMSVAIMQTGIARAITALGSVLFIACLGRLYGVAEVGQFALAQSLVAAATIFARFGRDSALMRFVGRDVRSPHVGKYLAQACIWSLVTGFILATLLFATRTYWALWFEKPELADLLAYFAIAVPPASLSFVLAGFLRAVRRPAVSFLLQFGAIAFVATCILLVLAYLYPHPSNRIATIGIAYSAASWIILIHGAWRCHKWFRTRYNPDHDSRSVYYPGAFRRSYTDLFISSLSDLMSSVLVIWVAGYFLSARDVGLFKAAQQLALLISYALVLANAIFPPRFASAFHRGNKEELAGLARGSARVALVIGSIPLVVCLLWPTQVLSILSSEFTAAGTLLRILALAQGVNIACGCVGYLLNMVGYEGIVRNVNVGTSVCALIFMVVFSEYYGVYVIAGGLAAAIVTRNIVWLVVAYKKIGVFCAPFSRVRISTKKVV